MFGFGAFCELPFCTIPVVTTPVPPPQTSSPTTGSDATTYRRLTTYERQRRRKHLEQMRRQAMTLAEELAEKETLATPAVAAVEAILAQAPAVENVLPLLRLEYLRAFPADVGIGALPQVSRDEQDDAEADQLFAIVGRLRASLRSAREVRAREIEIERLAVIAQAAADDEDDVAAVLAMW